MSSAIVELSKTEQARQECRDFLSRELLRAVSETIRPRILSVNNGLLPEARAAIQALPAGRGVFTALDCGEEICEMVEKWYAGTAVEPVCGSLFDLPRDTYDFIYSRTLLSDLSPLQARRAVLRLIWLLAPGGRLILTGFTDGHKGVTWSQEALSELSASLPEEALLGHTVTLSKSGGAMFFEAEA